MMDINATCTTIKYDIVAGKSVLILGPDLYINKVGNDNLERKQFFRKIQAENLGIQYFEQDEVFGAHNYELTLENYINDYFSGPGDIPLLELIATIKFPLILNASPDESLRKYFENIPQLNFTFDHFEDERDQNKSLPFSQDNPLLYNVFGAVSDPQSLIITHDSLYKAMQEVLPKFSFPKSIRDFLKNARSFIFLGFKFESWSYQLLSYKILSEDETKKNRMVKLSSSHFEDNNTVNIIMSSAMGMNFTENSASQLLNKIIQLLVADRRNNFLRTVNQIEHNVNFLSYAHEDVVHPRIDAIVPILKEGFNKKNNSTNSKFTLSYDEADLPYGQSIDSFMTRIGKGKTVLLVVSDKYLKSDYCMTEAIRVQRYNNEDERVFLILIEDGLEIKDKNIDSELYKNFWKTQLSGMMNGNKNPDRKKINELLDIIDYMEAFIGKIESYKHFRLLLSDIGGDATTGYFLKEPKQTEFSDLFLKAVFTKMNETN